MRQIILAAAAAFVAGGIATGALLAEAQPAPPPDAAPAAPAPAWAPHMPWMRHGPPGGAGMDRPGGPVGGPRALALIYRQQDRQLSPADVQKIAEAFLLWNGNHTWKVANVATNADGLIGFSLTTPEGSVVARFTMDPHTAKLMRVG